MALLAIAKHPPFIRLERELLEKMHDIVIGLFINRYEFGVSI
jgi:hypothetical protein